MLLVQGTYTTCIAEGVFFYVILLLNQSSEVQVTPPVQKRVLSKPPITMKCRESTVMGASGACKSTCRSQEGSCDYSPPDHQPAMAGQPVVPADSRRIRPVRQRGKPCVITVASLKHLSFGMSA